jgi:hypothetical protein
MSKNPSRTPRIALAMAVMLPIVIVGLADSRSSQKVSSSLPPKTVALRGVYLGTPEAMVRRQLGAPRQERSGENELNCEMGSGQPYGKTWEYEGLVVHLCKSRGEPTYRLFQMVVTGRKWRFPKGIGVGSPVQDLTRQLGQHEEPEVDDQGFTVVSYDLREPSADESSGLFWFRLRNGVVVELGMTEDWS